MPIAEQPNDDAADPAAGDGEEIGGGYTLIVRGPGGGGPRVDRSRFLPDNEFSLPQAEQEAVAMAANYGRNVVLKRSGGEAIKTVTPAGDEVDGDIGYL